MSHLFGVAPAKEFKTSRFSKIHVMSSGDTDIANNDSKFSKEIRLCSILLDKINRAKYGENIWINSDEMFSGTDPSSAEELCKMMMEEVANKSEYILGMYSTHYNDPTNLENYDKRFKNYHMGYVIKDGTDYTLQGYWKKVWQKYL